MRLTTAALLLAGCSSPLAAIDVTAPSVTSVYPSDGAFGISVTVSPQLCFDRAMQLSSLDGGVEIARRVGSKLVRVATAMAADPDGLCASFTPLAPLSPTSGYEIKVTTAALSAVGVEAAHQKSQTTSFQSSFFTVGQPTLATLWVPANGTIAAPLDLAGVLIAFSRPVAGASQPILVTPTGGASSLSADGLSATGLLPGALTSGEVVSLQLASDLSDPDGNPPQLPRALGFTVGSCAEGTGPQVTDATVVARDTDALAFFQVDRPSLCGAQVSEPDCPAATAVLTPAACSAPYDPCQAGLLCSCQLPLVGLCAGGTAQLTPLATGWNARVGSAPDSSAFQLSDPLPALVLNELMLSPQSSRTTGAFIEIANTGASPVDVLGITLANCKASPGCAVPYALQPFGAFATGGPTVLAGHAYALLVDPHFDPTQYASLPADTLLLAPLGGLPLLSLSATSPQPVGLFSAAGGPALSTFDGSIQVQKGVSFERIDPEAADPLPQGWALSAAPGGTPGGCNSVTPADDCPDATP